MVATTRKIKMVRYYYRIEFVLRQQEATVAEFEALLQKNIAPDLLKKPLFCMIEEQERGAVLSAKWVVYNSSLTLCPQIKNLLKDLTKLAMLLEMNKVSTQVIVQPQTKESCENHARLLYSAL